MNEKLDFVDRLDAAMKDRGLSPADITKRGGLSPSQVSKILNRESPAGEKALESFAVALNLPVEELYRWAGKFQVKPNSDETVTEITHIASQLNGDNRQDLLDYARLRLRKQRGK